MGHGSVNLLPLATRLSSSSHFDSETEARISPLARPPTHAGRSDGATVFVIEPEASVRESLQLTLEAEGILALSGSAFSDLLALKESRSITVVIADFAALQDTSGQGQEIVRSHCPFASIVGLASIFSVTSATVCVGNGAIFGFVTKPWLREELVSTVIAAAETAKMRETLSSLRRDLSALDLKQGQLVLQISILENELAQKTLDLRSGTALLQRQTDSLPNFTHQLLASRSRTVATRSKQLVAIARRFSELGSFNPEDGRKIILAAALSDLGLLGLDQNLLNKLHRPGASLSDEESRAYESHSVLSAQLAAHLDADDALRAIIRSHHERFDGTGFPDGLSGANIPWLARCLGVAVFLTETEQTQSEALAAVLSESGRQLDPEAVKLFCSLPKLLEDSSLFVRPKGPGKPAEEESVRIGAQRDSDLFEEFIRAEGYEDLLKRMTPLKDPRSNVGKSLDVLG